MSFVDNTMTFAEKRKNLTSIDEKLFVPQRYLLYRTYSDIMTIANKWEKCLKQESFKNQLSSLYLHKKNRLQFSK